MDRVPLELPVDARSCAGGVRDGEEADSPRDRRTFDIDCCGCRKTFRWRGHESSLARCPHCRSQLVILLEYDGRCTVLPKDGESVAEMICDWIGDRDENIDDEDDGFDSTEDQSSVAA